jgi:site-specific recombinase XerD
MSTRKKSGAGDSAKLMMIEVKPGEPIWFDEAESLSAWIRLYGALEAASNAENTEAAKGRDLDLFMTFFRERLNSDHPNDWTKSITSAFLRHLESGQGKKATTVNRVLSTLRHCSAWIHRRRPFLAGDPCQGIKELVTDEPAWKGLTDVDVMRLRSAAEQLVVLKNRKNQNAIRDLAIFQVLLHTGLRVSELLGLELSQFREKNFHDVKRKGKVRTSKVFVPPEARQALDRYVTEVRGDQAGPLFCSQDAVRLERQHVDRILKQLAAQANSKLKDEEKIKLSAHVLRHTFLRQLARKEGLEFAMEMSGHSSSRYIWRYTKPSQDEKEKALSELF